MAVLFSFNSLREIHSYSINSVLVKIFHSLSLKFMKHGMLWEIWFSYFNEIFNFFSFSFLISPFFPDKFVDQLSIADHGSHSRPGSSSGAVTPGKGSTGNSVGLCSCTGLLFSYQIAAVFFIMSVS